jgi:flavodoxin I
VKAALIYGTCTGSTWHAAELIAEALKPEIELESVDVNSISANDLNNWDFLVCGIPTWDVGELEYGWSDLYDNLDDTDLNVMVTMFALGDQYTYAETYQDAMGILYTKLIERGASGGIGFTPTDDHSFEESLAVVDGKFCGLALDEDNQGDLTEGRIAEWAKILKQEWPKILELKANQSS